MTQLKLRDKYLGILRVVSNREAFPSNFLEYINIHIIQ